MSRTDMYKLNFSTIKKIMDEHGMNQMELSRALGHAGGYITGIKRSGLISMHDIKLLCMAYGVKEDDLIYHEPPKPKPITQQQAAMGYNVAITATTDRLTATLEFNGQPLYRARAKIFGDDELDLIKSVSYATHLIYKMAEQDQLAREA